MSAFLQRLPNPPTTNFALPSSFKCSFSFLPTQISGCQLWLDGQDPNATGVLPANGSSVSAWKDKSGTTNNMSLTSGTVTYNSVTKAVNFQSGGVMTSVNSTAIIAYQSVVFVVCEATAVPGIGMVFACPNINPSGNLGDYSIRFASTTTLYDTNTNDIGYGSAYYVNGILGVPSSGLITVPSSQPNIIYALFNAYGTTTTFTLSSSFGLRYFVGNIQEVLVYTGPITTAQRQQVEGYLAWKWGLVANLPTNHPYKTITPSPLFSAQAFISTAIGQTPGAMTKNVTFNPTSIAGSVLWLDGADTSNMTFSSGTTISTWKDKSGNANNATATGSPALAQKGINGRQAVTAAVGTCFLGNVSMSGPNLTCFAVATTDVTLPNIRTPRADQRLVSLANGTNRDYDSTGGVIPLFNWDSTSIIGAYDNNLGNVNSNTIVTGTPFMAASRFDGTTASLWFNGAPGSFPSSADNHSFSITKYGIGNQANPTIEYWSGFIGEIILFSTALTISQRQQVEGYLAWKWGLQGTLPASHPYKMFPPPP